MAFGPVLSEELATDNYNSSAEAVGGDVTDLVDDIKFGVGFHAILGAKIKPPAFPLAFKIQGKYYVFPEIATSIPQSFLVVQGGVEFGLF
jgi:hypothetical protein